MPPRKKTKPAVAETTQAEAVAPVSESTALTIAPQIQAELTMIERLASNPRSDVKKLEALLDMRERTRAGEARLRFNQAMRDCQAEIMPVVRDAENKHTKSKFAKLESIDRAIRPIYTKHGFSLSFNSKALEGGGVRITCTAGHTDGHFEPYELEGELDTKGSQGNANKTSLQGLGSTVSYLRRYLTCMIFNVVIADEDNDAVAEREAAKKAGKGNDRFDDKMKGQQRTPGPVIDAGFTDVTPPAGAQPQGIEVTLNDGMQNKRFKSAAGAAKYLKASLENVKEKPKRLDILLDNTHILKALEHDGENELIAALHATANNGGGNGQ